MPISDQENQDHHHPPPQYLSRGRGRRKLLFFFLKCIIMFAVISVFLFFLGFAAAVLLHFLFLSNRHCTPSTAAPTAGEDSPPLLALLPIVTYTAAAFPTRSDCAICLDSFREGDECRNLPVCEHLFHAKCVDRWIRKKPTCPVCRTRVDLDLSGLSGSRIGGDDRWKRLWAVDFREGTSY